MSLQGKDAIEFLETLIVGDVASLDDRTGTLSVFTNEKGGIIDDSVITKASIDIIFCIPFLVPVHGSEACMATIDEINAFS